MPRFGERHSRANSRMAYAKVTLVRTKANEKLLLSHIRLAGVVWARRRPIDPERLRTNTIGDTGATIV
jgi:hypothetical protein